MPPNEFPATAIRLIAEVIRLQQPDHGRGAGGDAAVLLGCRDLITNVRTRRSTQSLTPPVGSKEHPSMACEHRTECLECSSAQHASGAPVVINDSGKRPFPFRSVQHSS